MNYAEYIPVPKLCEHYKIQETFFKELHEQGVLQIVVVEETYCLHYESIPIFEKIVRISEDLHINVEGIDVILNLLNTVENLKQELITTQNRLRLYE